MSELEEREEEQESVVLETSMGDVQLELYWDHTPTAAPV